MAYQINLTATKGSWDKAFEAFRKSLVRIPVTKVEDNISGGDKLTEGTSATFYGVFFRKQDQWSQSNPGLIQDADAVLLIDIDQTMNKDDRLTYNGEKFVVIDEPVLRSLNGQPFYKAARLVYFGSQ